MVCRFRREIRLSGSLFRYIFLKLIQQTLSQNSRRFSKSRNWPTDSDSTMNSRKNEVGGFTQPCETWDASVSGQVVLVKGNRILWDEHGVQKWTTQRLTVSWLLNEVPMWLCSVKNLCGEAGPHPPLLPQEKWTQIGCSSKCKSRDREQPEGTQEIFVTQGMQEFS